MMLTGQLTEESQCSLLMSTHGPISATFNVRFNVIQEHKQHKLLTKTTNYYETSISIDTDLDDLEWP